MFSIKQLSFCYQDKVIFKDAQVEFNDTSLVCIHGKSGCGKTTLLKILIFDLYADNEIIQYNNETINKEMSQEFLFNHITYIDQECTCLNNMTLYQHFEFYAQLYGKSINDEIIQDYLELVHLKDINLKKYPAYLSTGERKRFMIALGIMTGKNILLLDEPTASLDTQNKMQLIDVLKELSKKCLIICTSHDGYLLKNADEIYEIKDHQIIEQKRIESSHEPEIHKSSPKKVHYFKYKNLKLKFLFSILIILSCLLSFFIPFLVSLSIDLTDDVNEKQKSIQSTGLIFYKLPDARGMPFNETDFLTEDELKEVSEVSGIRLIQPYYCLLDGKSREAYDSMELVLQDGQKREKSYYWEKASRRNGIDFYANVAIVSYSSDQNIMIDGKKIDGIYIDENFQTILGEKVEGAQLNFKFKLPVEFELKSNDTIGKHWNQKFEEYELSFKIAGVMPNKVYSDENGNYNISNNYVRIYMPVEQVQSLLGKYALKGKHIYNNPMTYLVLCEDGEKDNVKMNIEKINELYQVHYQVEGVQYSETTDSSSHYMVLFMCGLSTLSFIVLSYYHLYSRRKEMVVLKHIGIEKQMRKYYMRDYIYMSIFGIISSILSCAVFIHTFQFKELNIMSVCMYWSLMTVIIIIFVIAVGYHGIHVMTKRNKI